MRCGATSHKFGEIQQKHYDSMRIDKKRRIKHEWNITLIRELIKFSEAMWNYRCTYVHEEIEHSMEMQTRSLAWKLGHNAQQTHWMVCCEDLHLFNRDKSFFKTGSIINVQSWVDIIQISIAIKENHEQATPQDIRKWIKGNNICQRKIRYAQHMPVRKYNKPSYLDKNGNPVGGTMITDLPIY